MLLNSKFNNFSIALPNDWIYKSITDRYLPFLKSELIPYATVIDFINSTVQSISWPDMALDKVEQTFKNSIPSFRSGWEANRGYTRELTLSFRCTENYLNYFIMKDQLERYYDTTGDLEKNGKAYLPDLMLHLLNSEGQIVMSIVYKNIVFFGLSSLELSFSSNMPEFRSFDIQLAYETVELKRHFEK